jgi:hypothetical protein
VARVLVSITLGEVSDSVGNFVLEMAVSMVIAVVVPVPATFVSAVVTASLSVEVVSRTIVSEPVEDGAEIDIIESKAVVKALEPNHN